MTTHNFISFLYDTVGNITGIGGVWNVPDDFDPDAEYLIFATDFKSKHPTKTGRLTERQRKTQVRSWTKWMNEKFEKVSWIHHED